MIIVLNKSKILENHQGMNFLKIFFLITCTCPHGWIIEIEDCLGSLHIDVEKSSFWLKRRKYGEKEEKDACLLNIYPMANQGNEGPNHLMSPL